MIATNSAGDGPASAEVRETADAQTALVRAASENTPATGQPTISGTAKVGQTLTADTSGIDDTDGIANATFRYQWILSDGTTDSDIQNATSTTYTPVTWRRGKTIRVRVSFSDDKRNEESLTSEATVAVLKADALTAELQDVPDSHDGSEAFTFRILFSEDVTVGFAALKKHSFEVSNATIQRAQRVDRRHDLRKFTVKPSSDLAVVMVLEAGPALRRVWCDLHE